MRDSSQRLLNQALIEVVRKFLTIIQYEELDKDNYCYVSFYTNHKAVKLPTKIKERYPQEITIVFQHQFENLKVNEHQFSVRMSFDGVYETIEVPFSLIHSFMAPNIKLTINTGLTLQKNIEDFSAKEAEKDDCTEHGQKKVSKNNKVSAKIIKLTSVRYKESDRR